MQTTKWGPHLWVALHTIVHNYNPKIHDPKIYKRYFELTAEVLPCKYCRESFKQYMKELPIDPYLGSQEDLTYWLYLMHNKVNNKLRKQGLLQSKDPSFQQVYNKYENFRADCSKKKNKPDTCRLPDFKDRCQALTKKGRQCTRKRIYSDRVCNQHKLFI